MRENVTFFAVSTSSSNLPRRAARAFARIRFNSSGSSWSKNTPDLDFIMYSVKPTTKVFPSSSVYCVAPFAASVSSLSPSGSDSDTCCCSSITLFCCAFSACAIAAAILAAFLSRSASAAISSSVMIISFFLSVSNSSRRATAPRPSNAASLISGIYSSSALKSSASTAESARHDPSPLDNCEPKTLPMSETFAFTAADSHQVLVSMKPRLLNEHGASMASITMASKGNFRP